eukprot:scaffold1680_cov139-Skeletonema_menzelii.AAC.12
MKFTTSVIAVALAAAAPSVSAFSTAGFSRSVATTAATSGNVIVSKSTHASTCACPSCVGFHSMGCGCVSCGGVALRMSTVEEVPAEVEAMDGVASDEEAHNVDRPARESGISKHKEGDKPKRVELKDLEIGAEVTAKVKTVTSYGAFLDIGAKSDALIHVSRLSDDFVSNVEDVVKQGDEISVRIISVDTDKNQIGVTMRSVEAEENAANNGGRPSKRRERPQRSGGDQASQAASINALSEKGYDDSVFVEGEVVSALAFGAFVRFDTAQLGEGLTGEVDGLVHISALSEGRTNSVEDVVSVGDKVQVRVRAVEADAGRISLSMISKEQEEASRPASRQRNEGGGGRAPDAVTASWKDTGAADWKEQMEQIEQPGFTNTAIVVDRRK